MDLSERSAFNGGMTNDTASRSSQTPFDWSDPSGWDAALRGVAAVYTLGRTPRTFEDYVVRVAAAGAWNR